MLATVLAYRVHRRTKSAPDALEQNSFRKMLKHKRKHKRNKSKSKNTNNNDNNNNSGSSSPDSWIKSSAATSNASPTNSATSNASSGSGTATGPSRRRSPSHRRCQSSAAAMVKLPPLNADKLSFLVSNNLDLDTRPETTATQLNHNRYGNGSGNGSASGGSTWSALSSEMEAESTDSSSNNNRDHDHDDDDSCTVSTTSSSEQQLESTTSSSATRRRSQNQSQSPSPRTTTSTHRRTRHNTRTGKSKAKSKAKAKAKATSPRGHGPETETTVSPRSPRSRSRPTAGTATALGSTSPPSAFASASASASSSSSSSSSSGTSVVFEARGKTTRLSGLVAYTNADGVEELFFNDKSGNVYRHRYHEASEMQQQQQQQQQQPVSLDRDAVKLYAKTFGRPNGMCTAVRPATGHLHLLVADLVTKSVLTVTGERQFTAWADRINTCSKAKANANANAKTKPKSKAKATTPSRRRKFQGPSCVLADHRTGNIFFTDAGALSNCSAGSLKGGVFVAEAPTAADATAAARVVPIVESGLGFPTGLAWLGRNDLLVCESFLNRILRCKLDDSDADSQSGSGGGSGGGNSSGGGAWRVTVFAKFQKRFGPTAIAVRRNRKRSGLREKCDGDRVSIFVAHSSLRGGEEDAVVLRLNPRGEVAQEYALPSGSRYITSMALRSPEAALITTGNQILQVGL